MADAERARDLAARLERRANAEDEVAARETYLTLLDISAGERDLDVGCGSGAVTRDIAKRVGERGLAVGLDPSPRCSPSPAGLPRGRAWVIARVPRRQCASIAVAWRFIRRRRVCGGAFPYSRRGGCHP
jgi:SAM-dependent methyltransferase